MKLIGGDFDGTVYFGNGSIDFFRYCASKNSGLYRYYFKNIFNDALFAFGKKTFKKQKDSFYAFLPHVEDLRKRWSRISRGIKTKK